MNSYGCSYSNRRFATKTACTARLRAAVTDTDSDNLPTNQADKTCNALVAYVGGCGARGVVVGGRP